MGLLSKLFKRVGKDVAEELLYRETEKAVDYLADNISEAVQNREEELKEAVKEVTIPGNSWGPTMPLEENQYNFKGGDHVAYFEKILTEDFPACRLEKEQPRGSRATVITLWEGDSLAVVVELLNKSTVRNKLRRDCQKSGIPYVRFYYDAEGWWNTRAYVKERIQKAMESAM